MRLIYYKLVLNHLGAIGWLLLFFPVYYYVWCFVKAINHSTGPISVATTEVYLGHSKSVFQLSPTPYPTSPWVCKLYLKKYYEIWALHLVELLLLIILGPKTTLLGYPFKIYDKICIMLSELAFLQIVIFQAFWANFRSGRFYCFLIISGTKGRKTSILSLNETSNIVVNFFKK